MCEDSVCETIFFYVLADAPNFVYLITSGIPPAHKEEVFAEVATLKKRGVHIAVVTTAANANMSDLQTIASNPDDVILAEDYSDVAQLSSALLMRSCKEKSKIAVRSMSSALMASLQGPVLTLLISCMKLTGMRASLTNS